MRRELGDGYELDDDGARTDRHAVHRYPADAHGLYRKLGFEEPGEGALERGRSR